MEGFSVSSSISSDDWRAYARAVALRSVPPRRRSLLPGLIITSLLVGCGAAWWVGAGHQLHFPSVLAGFLVIAIQSAVSTYFARTGAAPSEDGAFLGHREFNFSPKGLLIRRSGSETVVEWQVVQDLTMGPDHLFVWTDRLASHLVPVRDLPPGRSASDVAAQIREWIEAAKRDHAQPVDLGEVQIKARTEVLASFGHRSRVAAPGDA